MKFDDTEKDPERPMMVAFGTQVPFHEPAHRIGAEQPGGFDALDGKPLAQEFRERAP